MTSSVLEDDYVEYENANAAYPDECPKLYEDMVVEIFFGKFKDRSG
jgi:hypothetical protein